MSTLIDTRDTLRPLIPPGWNLGTEAPVCIPNYDEPAPDLAVVEGKARYYVALNRPPDGSEVKLVVEIAESSLARDRTDKWAAYASGGIPVYWIVNLMDEQIEFYTEPSSGGYQRRDDFKPGQDIPVRVNRAEQGRIAVAIILP